MLPPGCWGLMLQYSTSLGGPSNVPGWLWDVVKGPLEVHQFQFVGASIDEAYRDLTREDRLQE